MISGGRLRWSASVLRAATTLDALGRRTNTFTEQGTMRVDLRESGSSEQPYADGVAVVANWEIRTRWPNIARLGVTELDRLTVRGRTLRINGIRNLDERDRVAVLDCSEVL
jgi:head-tail adaptor